MQERSTLTPGYNSTLFTASFLLGAGLLAFGKNENDYDRAVFSLIVAGTTLLTNNATARTTAVIGGLMRCCPSTTALIIGTIAQIGALGFATRESIKAGMQLRRTP